MTIRHRHGSGASVLRGNAQWRIVSTALLAGLLMLVGEASAFDWQLPPWAPRPIVPADNPMSEAKFQLGRHLFHDKRLSANRSMACASCHSQPMAFTDGRANPSGITGQKHPRSSMTLTNAGYLAVYTWANPSIRSLEDQMLGPLLGERPVELGMGGREAELIARLRADERYVQMFREAFPSHEGEISLRTIAQAVASFQRALVSFTSPYDRYRFGGETGAISESARRGEALFTGERLRCHLCHPPPLFTDNALHQGLDAPRIEFHNIGLYNVADRGRYPPANPGIAAATGRREDDGKFRTPTLRNVALTDPYMHDGSVQTLREAILHYAAGGRTVTEGSYPGRGSTHPNKSARITGFAISEQEIADVVEFLKALTDRQFVENPRYADPFRPPRAQRPAQ